MSNNKYNTLDDDLNLSEHDIRQDYLDNVDATLNYSTNINDNLNSSCDDILVSDDVNCDELKKSKSSDARLNAYKNLKNDENKDTYEPLHEIKAQNNDTKNNDDNGFNVDAYDDFRYLKDKNTNENKSIKNDDIDLKEKRLSDIDSSVNTNFSQSFDSESRDNKDNLNTDYKNNQKKIKLIILGIIIAFLVLAIVTIFSIYARDDDSKVSSQENKDFSINKGQILANLKKDHKNAQSQIVKRNEIDDNNLENILQNTQDTSLSDNLNYDAQYYFDESLNDVNNDANLNLKETRRSNFLSAMSASSKVSLSLNNSLNTPSFTNSLHDSNDSRASNVDTVDEKLAHLRSNEQGENSNQSIAPDLKKQTHTIYDYDALSHDAYTLNHQVQSIKNPYTLRQGTVIPAILLTGINSQLPGQVTAQVTRDVFDSPYGKFLLIPKGSKIIGQYLSDPKIGQERAMLGFNRIIFPDARALNIGSMPAMGLDGMSGLDADVNTHFMRLVSYSVLLGGINTTISLNQRGKYDKDGNISFNSAASESLSQTLGQTLSDIIKQNMSIAPTLEVDAGFAFNVTLTKDIFFNKPYKDYKY